MESGYTRVQRVLIVRSGISLILGKLAQRKAPDRVFADAAEVQFVIVLYDIGDLGVTPRSAVLEVLDDAALSIKGEDERVTLRCGLQRFRQSIDDLTKKWTRKQAVEEWLTWRDEREPEFVFAV